MTSLHGPNSRSNAPTSRTEEWCVCVCVCVERRPWYMGHMEITSVKRHVYRVFKNSTLNTSFHWGTVALF